jgi:hypothetical protein
MNRKQKLVLRVVAFAFPLAALGATLAPTDATAQYIAPPPPQPGPPPPPMDPQLAPPPPPDAYIATTQPEYYEGRPVYFYNGNWYYRDERGAWSYYRNEPAYLRDRRAHWNEGNRRYHYRR